MGTTAQLVALGPTDTGRRLADGGLAELRRLESLWSRFSDDSELSRLVHLEGAPALVSKDSALLISLSECAKELTGGLFDATLLDAVEAAGYDRSFELMEAVSAGTDPGGDCSSSTSAMTHDRPGPVMRIEADVRSGLVRLPKGVRIDPGGIGKGLAADLVARSLCERGASGALVSVGGDLRVAGTPPGPGWEIELDHHVVPCARINLLDGAVATSTRLRRRWRTTDGIAHHIIDPRTRCPSTGPALAVSVVAAEGWWAEALATAVLVGYGTPGFDDLEAELLEQAGALVTTSDRQQHRLGRLDHSFLTDEVSDCTRRNFEEAS